MFGMGMPEILLILAIALIVIGPKKLPDLAKSLGRAMREFKRATSELKDSMEIDTELGDVKKAFNDMRQEVRQTVDVTGSSKTSTDKPPETPGADKPPETPGADKPPETPGADKPPEAPGADKPPETSGADKSPEAEPAQAPPVDKDRSVEGSERNG
jgi:TatA/E family protein of Tat protein translocase